MNAKRNTETKPAADPRANRANTTAWTTALPAAPVRTAPKASPWNTPLPTVRVQGR